MKKSKKPGKLMASLLETAQDFRDSGIMDERTYTKITKRNLADKPRFAAAQVTMLTAGEIRTLREESNLSQAVFAKILNVTVGYVSQLERGIKHPKGSALALLNVIRRKGIEAVL
jgi:putative transcriptional regulator